MAGADVVALSTRIAEPHADRERIKAEVSTEPEYRIIETGETMREHWARSPATSE